MINRQLLVTCCIILRESLARVWYKVTEREISVGMFGRSNSDLQTSKDHPERVYVTQHQKSTSGQTGRGF